MTTYRERLTAPPSWWLAALIFALIWGWVFVVATTWAIASVVVVILTVIGFFMVWRYGSVLISVEPEGLRVGAAFVESAHLGAITSLDRAAYRTKLGTGADARAHLMTRPYLDHGVVVEIADPTDPTPYWLVSSRHPVALAAALGAPQQTQDQQPSLHDPIGDTPRGEEA